MPVIRGGSNNPIFEYYDESVSPCSNISYMFDNASWQEHLVDFSFRASDGLSVDCHKLIASTLSSFMRTLLCEGQCDQIILPDFCIGEICGLLNFYYTGRLVK